jgi:hypothetical protein
MPGPRLTLTHALLLSTGAVAGYAVRALAQRSPTNPGNFWAKAFAPTPQLPAAIATPRFKRPQQWLANSGTHSTPSHVAREMDLVWCVLRNGSVASPRAAITYSWLHTGSPGDVMWWYPGPAQPQLPPPDYAVEGTSSVAPTEYQPYWLPHTANLNHGLPWFLDPETPVWCQHRSGDVTGPQPAHRVNWRVLNSPKDVMHFSRANPAPLQLLQRPAKAKPKPQQWLANPGDKQGVPVGLKATQSVWYVQRDGTTCMALQADTLKWCHSNGQHSGDVMWYVPWSPNCSPDHAPQFAALAPYGDWLPYVHAWLPVRGDDNILPPFLNPSTNVWLQLRDLTVTGPLVASSVSWLHRGRQDDVLQYSRTAPSATWHANPGDSSAVPERMSAHTQVWIKTRAGKVTGPHSAHRVMWLHDPYVSFPGLDVMFYATTDPQPHDGGPPARTGRWYMNTTTGRMPPLGLAQNPPVWVLRRNRKVTGPHNPGKLNWQHDPTAPAADLHIMEYTTDPQP